MSRIERIGPHTLYLGDSAEILQSIAPVDACVMDPPYGIGFAAQPTDYQRKNGMKPADWDNAPAPDWLMGLMREKAGTLIVWGGNYYSLPPTRGWLAWRKPDAPPSMAHLELAWTSYDMNAKMLDHSIAATNAERAGHPTQKPVAVMAPLIEYSCPPGGTVLDPFIGSGTTAQAALQLGMSCIGIEIDPDFAEMARNPVAPDAPLFAL